MDYFKQWSAKTDEFNEVFARNPSLAGMMKGYLAEEKLRPVLSGHPKVKNLRSPDDHDRSQKGDWKFEWEGRTVTVEVKCLQSNFIEETDDGWRGKYQCDASDKRPVTLSSGDTIETTLLKRGEFDILAVAIFDFNEEWKFIFAKNKELPRTTYSNYTNEQQNELIKGTHTFKYPLEKESIYTENIWSLL